ncbi:plant lipid transfer protein/Par allergen [Artemisia annua]|uniref:Non-specific lipid-transfer protein n=1 Tax=Artemisia annua TaxID=35608 RepID=A0A2U1PBN6_ARTAN|nr:plant lipid transfer protein/Par allergen [Artemisia annua]
MTRNGIAILGLVMASMLMMVPFGKAITCGQVVSTLAPCLGYLTQNGAVTPPCCGAVKALAANSAPNKRTICGCLKSIYASNSAIKISNSAINLDNANALPGKCGVNIPYKINPSTDC